MKTVALLAALSLLPALEAAGQSPGFLIIVNAQLENTPVQAAQVSGVFLLPHPPWDPVDQQAGSAVRESFSRAIHGMTTAQVVSQQAQHPGRQPPAVLSSDQAVVDYVSRSRYGAGYVTAGATLGPGVRILRVPDCSLCLGQEPAPTQPAADFVTLEEGAGCGAGGQGRRLSLVNKNGQQAIKVTVSWTRSAGGGASTQTFPKVYTLSPGGQTDIACSKDGSSENLIKIRGAQYL